MLALLADLPLPPLPGTLLTCTGTHFRFLAKVLETLLYVCVPSSVPARKLLRSEPTGTLKGKIPGWWGPLGTGAMRQLWLRHGPEARTKTAKEEGLETY